VPEPQTTLPIRTRSSSTAVLELQISPASAASAPAHSQTTEQASYDTRSTSGRQCDFLPSRTRSNMPTSSVVASATDCKDDDGDDMADDEESESEDEEDAFTNSYHEGSR
jgi:hypothetical protein